ncbi:MAG TPA: hypothetical protein VH539_18745 [Gemmatimonadaceae bacterium]
MFTSFLPSTEEIALAFADEIATLCGSVSDSYDDGRRLFMRAILPPETEVRPGDALRAGVALQTTGPIVGVYPYTFRRVCTNGAIAAHVTHARLVARVEVATPIHVTVATNEAIRLAVRECATAEAVATVRDEIVRASMMKAQLMLHVLPLLSRHPSQLTAEMLRMLTDEFARAGDDTLYGVMNAITAVARETRDPEARWQLETYGGGIPALARQAPHRPSADRELIGA